LDYDANLDGANWFCREIWPRVCQTQPDAVFQLVGSRPGPAAQRLGRLPGVNLVGEVPDVRPYLRDAAVVVVPLRVARGIQNKVLEALAMGKAVVATPPALEGIGLNPDLHARQAATADQWVRSVSELLSDPAQRRRWASPDESLSRRIFTGRHVCRTWQPSQAWDGVSRSPPSMKPPNPRPNDR
jgi:polysaccharide biosynthesis protein PslH